MAKFKVGDRVRVVNMNNIIPYISVKIGDVGTVSDDTNYRCIVKFDFNPLTLTFAYENLELVEPKEDSTYKKPLIFSPFSKHDIYINGKVRTYGVETIEQPCNMPHEPKRLQVTFIEHTEKLPSQEVPKVEPKQDNAFKLDPHEFPYYHFSLDDEVDRLLRKTRNPLQDVGIKEILSKSWEQYQRSILGVRTPKKDVDDSLDAIKYGYDNMIKHLVFHQKDKQERNIKNRIPDRVVFNQDKGKVTVLISKFNDGVAPYRSYTSKVNVEGGDKYDAQFGFLLSYYKYLIRMYDKDKQKELIERIFNLLPTKRYPFLLGAVETEMMKLDGIKSYKTWEDLYIAITEPCLKGNGTWDYLEWKEMLRVHELETKREKQREVNKEIKKHQKAIEELKKKEV